MTIIRKAYVVRVGDKFVGGRHLHRKLVDFGMADLFTYKQPARRVAYKKRADEIMEVTITLEGDFESQVVGEYGRRPKRR
jgi:hypothetical protein